MQEGVQWADGPRVWVVRSPSLIEEGLRSTKLSAARGPRTGSTSPRGADELDRLLASWPMYLEGERHEAARSVALQAFRTLDTAATRTRITSIIDHIVDEVRRLERLDAISAIARPIAERAVQELFEIPTAAFETINREGKEVVSFIGAAERDEASVAQAVRATETLTASLSELSSCRGLEVIRRAANERECPEDAADAVALNLFIDGQQPLESVLATGILRACQGHSLDTEAIIADASPFAYCGRVAVEPLILGGVEIATGGRVRFAISEAARADESSQRQLAFGAGRHSCPAARYVRFVLAATMRAIHQHGRLALDPHGLPEESEQEGYRAVACLPVIWAETG